MKKIKIIFALLAFLPFSKAFAQEGEIIYRDFEPDSILIYWHKLGPIWIDLDVDGEADDLMMRMEIMGGTVCHPAIFSGDWSTTSICYFEENDPNMILSEVAEEDWRPYVSWSGGPTAAHYTHYGFRIQREDGYYYGWFETYSRYVNRTTAHFGFDRTAYCTIPNYPLVWGQTEFWDIVENKGEAIGKLHPNPTTGMVRIEGENASEVQVFNALGQLVKTVQNANEVGLEGLPQGVYLLRVTLEGGKVFSDKVVKE